MYLLWAYELMMFELLKRMRLKAVLKVKGMRLFLFGQIE